MYRLRVKIRLREATWLNSYSSFMLNQLYFCWGVEPPTKFWKRGGLTGPQLWEGAAGKEGLTFFRGVAILLKK